MNAELRYDLAATAGSENSSKSVIKNKPATWSYIYVYDDLNKILDTMEESNFEMATDIWDISASIHSTSRKEIQHILQNIPKAL